MMFKIGEFARIANVSTHLLRHYDDIGLFAPVEIDQQSGYRYYKVDQLPSLHRIIALRELGLTLEQVAQLLSDNITDCEIEGMLLLKRQQVEQLLEGENRRLRRIENRLAQIKADQSPATFDVVVKGVSEFLFLSTGRRLMSDADAAHALVEASMFLRKQDALLMDYAIALPYDVMTADGLHHIEIGYSIKHEPSSEITLSSGIPLSTREVEAVETMATVIYQGPRRHNHQVYQAIFMWMDANHYQYRTGICPRELYHQAAADDLNPDNIIEIQVPIIEKVLA